MEKIRIKNTNLEIEFSKIRIAKLMQQCNLFQFFWCFPRVFVIATLLNTIEPGN